VHAAAALIATLLSDLLLVVGTYPFFVDGYLVLGHLCISFVFLNAVTRVLRIDSSM
jgi:hypothetical protein